MLDLRDVAPALLPRRLADVHLDTAPGDEVPVALPALDPQRRADVVEGAGFDDRGDVLVRLRSLPDTVGPDCRLLVCGLNPSLHAADAGVGFVTPSNRFWRAATAADLLTATHDPRHALDVDRVGMTDLVKRATPRAAELRTAEYRAGLDRLTRLCEWLRPGAVVFVGLAGWRAAVDRRAGPGWHRPLGPTPVYVMPSTSGLNAATSLDDLTEHLRTAVAGAPT